MRISEVVLDPPGAGGALTVLDPSQPGFCAAISGGDLRFGVAKSGVSFLLAFHPAVSYLVAGQPLHRPGLKADEEPPPDEAAGARRGQRRSARQRWRASLSTSCPIGSSSSSSPPHSGRQPSLR